MAPENRKKRRPAEIRARIESPPARPADRRADPAETEPTGAELEQIRAELEAHDRPVDPPDEGDPYTDPAAAEASRRQARAQPRDADGTLSSDEAGASESGHLQAADLGFVLVDTGENELAPNTLAEELTRYSLEIGTDPDELMETMDEHFTDDDVRADFASRQQLGSQGDALLARMLEHNAKTPELSGGDVDAAWEDAGVSGEESVGSTVVTPDQDVVDELGEAVGITYADDEPLRTADKLDARDRQRWELDPRSAADLEEAEDLP